MNLPYRIELMSRLGKYMLSEEPAWKDSKEKAGWLNPWFIPPFVEIAVGNIAHIYLEKDKLQKWVENYSIKELDEKKARTIGLVTAGNIPLVGFHDLLSIFISGHKAKIKPSTKDETLMRHLVDRLIEWDKRVRDYIEFAEMLKGCDAYIATGSNNTAGYFDYYFGKYPNIIRRHRTSVAILQGNESNEDLEKLADDIFMFFGLGCRNVTKIYVPEGYEFAQLLSAMRKYDWMEDHNKYRNNYDYYLTLHVLNKKQYMSTKALLLVEDFSPFSPISQLNYEYYSDEESLKKAISGRKDLQCIVGKGFVPFGESQSPTLADYADQQDTLKFLTRL